MAAILVETLVPNLGAAMQACLADFMTYVPNVTWTYTIASAGSSGRKSLDSVINDTVNVTTRRYIINNMGSGNSLNPALMLSQQGCADVSPPVMPLVYGARNTRTDWTTFFWNTLKAVLATWGTNISTASDNLNCTNVPTGFTMHRFMWMPQQAGGMGLLQAVVVTRDPAVATIVATGPFPADFPPNVLGYGGITAPLQASIDRMSAALEALLLKGRDFSFNSGNIHVSSNGSVVGP